MGYEIAIEQKPTYLHLIGTGEMSAGNARRFLVDAYRAAGERNCACVLLDMRFSGSLGLGSIFSVIEERSHEGIRLKRVAYVEANLGLRPDAAEFATLVATNRGVNVRLFSCLADAERWLEATPSDTAQPQSAAITQSMKDDRNAGG
jgi:hypothetical protein